METQTEIFFGGQQIVLQGGGTVWLPKTQTLLVADLHLGKDASFRHSGIPVPNGINAKTLQLLADSIDAVATQHVVILGDLIHDGNSMTAGLIEQFSRWRDGCSDIRVSLVRGNHDRYINQFPVSWNITEHHSLRIDSLELVHQTSLTESESCQKNSFQIGGHWHPVVDVGRGADKIRLSCFVLDGNTLMLPAFGPFKGGMKQKRTAGRTFFPICEQQIWREETRQRVSG